jgi:hypothetical protein
MTRDKGDRATTYIVGTGIALAMAGMLYFIPKREEQKPAQNQAATMPASRQNEISLELYVSKTDNSIVEVVGLSMDEGARKDLFRNGPVFYDIPGVFPYPAQLQVPAGTPGIRIELPKPQSLAGRVIHIYRIDPATRQEQTIMRADLGRKQ